MGEGAKGKVISHQCAVIRDQKQKGSVIRGKRKNGRRGERESDQCAVIGYQWEKRGSLGL
jgi:hypothetical protein